MDQFRMLYCTCKVPGVKKDTIRNYFKTEREGPCPSHLVVMCRGRIFTFDALYDGQILTPPELLRQLSYVKERCEREPEGDGVAVLTSEERTRWAKAREHLISIDPHNKTILETIQSSLFVVSLDETKPYSTPENYTNMTLEALTGNPTIRWGDKSYNSIVFSDGTFGSTCDHAPYDAMVLVSMCWYVDQQIKATEANGRAQTQSDPYLFPRRWYTGPPGCVLRFHCIRKISHQQKKLHPDTFIQLAMQLAFYRIHKGPGSCYETAMTRKFYHGRTETMRPCTQEAVNWCKAMMDSTCDVNVKRKAMLLAFNKHNKLMAEAQEAKGFDRHLLGLYLIAKEAGLPTPELFMDPLYAKSGGGGNFVLSSSLVGYTTVLGAVAPMVHHGYGFFYRIRDDRIVISISAWNHATKRCCVSIQQFL
ncbi:hypothetical protein INR49_007529 [Caranx melampygus]|nr:hypothetical protein INR49_007529 [Caranx melampygus]